MPHCKSYTLINLNTNILKRILNLIIYLKSKTLSSIWSIIISSYFPLLEPDMVFLMFPLDTSLQALEVKIVCSLWRKDGEYVALRVLLLKYINLSKI